MRGVLVVGVIAYASRTGTERNLDAMRRHGWRVLVSAKGEHRSEGMPYAIDNGAWTSHMQGQPFDFVAFEQVLKMAPSADWVIAPDIVCGGMESLALSVSWLPRLLSICPRVLIAVQNGMTAEDVAPYVGPRVGIAIGGDTAWKEESLQSRRFSRLGCYLHALRVNSIRRVELCHWAGCDSHDGTSVTRYAKNIHKLDAATRQEALPWAM